MVLCLDVLGTPRLHEHTRKKKAGKMKDMDADMPLFLGAPHAFHPLVHPDCLFLTFAVRQGWISARSRARPS